MEALAEMIAYQSTLTDTDCYAVLRALERNIAQELSQGRIVRLGTLGNFKPVLVQKGKIRLKRSRQTTSLRVEFFSVPEKNYVNY